MKVEPNSDLRLIVLIVNLIVIGNGRSKYFDKISIYRYIRSYIYHLNPAVVPFIGRVKEFQSLNNWFKIEDAIVITGERGVGKTELAKKYAEYFSTNNSNVFWINTTTIHDMVSDLKNVSRLIGIFNDDKKFTILTSELPIYVSFKPTLFVFDNASFNNYFIDKIIRLAKKSLNLKILVTSRYEQWEEDKFDILKLNVFTKKEILKYIGATIKNEFSSIDDTKFKKLAGILDGLPLNMKFSVAFIKKHLDSQFKDFYTIDYFINLLNVRSKAFAELSSLHDFEESIRKEFPIKRHIETLNYLQNKYGRRKKNPEGFVIDPVGYRYFVSY